MQVNPPLKEHFEAEPQPRTCAKPAEIAQMPISKGRRSQGKADPLLPVQQHPFGSRQDPEQGWDAEGEERPIPTGAITFSQALACAKTRSAASMEQIAVL